MRNTQFLERVFNQPWPEQGDSPKALPPPEVVEFSARDDGSGDRPADAPPAPPPPADTGETVPPVAAPSAVPVAEPAPPAETSPPPPAEKSPAPAVTAEPAPSAAVSGTTKAPAPAAPALASSPPVRSPGENSRDRGIYFMRLDPEGSILRIRVTRQIPVSDSPLIDTLQALLRGPSPEEARQGLMTLIPEDARILSALVRDQTAYLNFNEEFQFNTYGMEGYVAQLRQVVWTATEFPTVADVQILIEGRRLDYLGESIRIGSPLSREGL